MEVYCLMEDDAAVRGTPCYNFADFVAPRIVLLGQLMSVCIMKDDQQFHITTYIP